jgi:hypothetical protein
MASPSSSVRDPFKSMKKQPAPKAKAATPLDVSFGDHGRYQVKSGFLSGVFVARAFPKAPTKAQGMIAEATGATEAEAVEALHKVIDAREDKRTRERRQDAHTGISIPSVEEYGEAIRQVTLSKTQRLMLAALSLAGEDGLTDQRMTSAAGYKSQTSANRSFTSAGRLLAEYLSVPLDADEGDSALDGSVILGFRDGTGTEDVTGNWIMHAELRDAVRAVF